MSVVSRSLDVCCCCCSSVAVPVCWPLVCAGSLGGAGGWGSAAGMNTSGASGSWLTAARLDSVMVKEEPELVW